VPPATAEQFAQTPEDRLPLPGPRPQDAGQYRVRLGPGLGPVARR
jgi:hypothetical protein